LAAAVSIALANPPAARAAAAEVAKHPPIGQAKGIHPGRVVWVHDADATDWEGPGHEHWWEPNHTDQARVSEMLSQALRKLTGQDTDKAAWEQLFRHFNKTHGRGDRPYRPGEKIVVKVNLVGFIWSMNTVNKESYKLQDRQDYMNTSPQVMLALLRQLVDAAGVKQADISLGDTLAYFANEYYDVLHGAMPEVRYFDRSGKAGRISMKESTVPIYWSCRPRDVQQDYVPTCFAEADYVINLANLKAHTGTGVTLTAKNHFGSLVRAPNQKGYYDLHSDAYSAKTGAYRSLVDLTGHAHLGGKTVLFLIDGLYGGVHPIDSAPRKWKTPPFNGDWTSSLFASQDPVAIDSVGLDFVQAEYENPARKGGTEDFLHESALADNPPSGTFYDPDHASETKRLTSLGVHEHWNNAVDKRYSRNRGGSSGIELVAVEQAGAAKPASAAAKPASAAAERK
jgi:uncharacterized protein (DUF362 family)